MPFDYQPVLKGRLVELRPLQAADYEALACRGTLIVVDVNSRQIIGSSRFHGYDSERSEVEIGWTFLARSHWGGRYNGELKQLMLRHAFHFVSRVTTRTADSQELHHTHRRPATADPRFIAVRPLQGVRREAE